MREGTPSTDVGGPEKYLDEGGGHRELGIELGLANTSLSRRYGYHSIALPEMRDASQCESSTLTELSSEF